MGNRIISKGEKIIDCVQGNKEYDVGDLYIKDTNYRCNKEVVCIYDDKSQNVHFYDKSDSKKMMDIECCVQKIQKIVSSILKTKYADVYSNEDDGFNGTLKIAGTPVKYNTGECVRLFRYISVTINGIAYELNFMRFYIDKDKRINCILGSPQFDRCTGKYINQEGICYPDTADSEVIQLENNIASMKKSSIKNYCYNPGIEELHFEKAADSDYIIYYAFLLAQEFMEFIIENESINVDNTVKYNLFLHGAKIPFYDYDYDITSRVIFDNRVGLGNYHLAPRDNYLRCHSANSIDTNLYAIAKSSLLEKYRCKLSRYGNYEPIYRFARIKTKTKYYDLMGFRMAKNNNGTVNCEMESYQFICADKNAFDGSTQKFKSWEVYPNSLENGKKTSSGIQKSCKNEANARAFYYNPKTKFVSKEYSNEILWDKSIQQIVDEFLEFVWLNECKSRILNIVLDENKKMIHVNEDNINEYFDGSSGNYHIWPKNDKCSSNYSPSEKWRAIKDKLRTKCEGKKNIKFFDTNNVSKYYGFYNCCCVGIIGTDRVYELMVTRLAKINDKLLCNLNCLQYEFYFKENGIINDDTKRGNLSAPKSFEMYPESLCDSVLRITKNGCYYNPDTSFYASEEEIINSFFAFIEKNERKYEKGV